MPSPAYLLQLRVSVIRNLLGTMETNFISNNTVDIAEGKRYLEYKNQMKKKLKIIKEELVRSTTKPIDSILFD